MIERRTQTYNENDCDAYNNYRTYATLSQLRAFAAPSGHDPYGGGRPFHGGCYLPSAAARSAVRSVRRVCTRSRLVSVVTSSYVRSSRPGRPIFTFLILFYFLISIAVGQSKRVFPESYAGYDEQNGRTQVRSTTGTVRGV